MKRRQPVFILMVPVVLVLLSMCMPSLLPPSVPTQTRNPPPVLETALTDEVVPSPTPLPATDTPTPVVTPLPVDEYQATAWTSLDRPGWGSVQTVFARLTRGGQGVANARMYSIVHDQDADRRWPGEGFAITGDDGIASTSFIVVDNPVDYVVHLDVYLVYEGITYQADTSFAPQC